MNWSIDEFLDLIDVRSLNWCFIDLAANSGFRVAHGDCVHIHAVLDGRVRLTGETGDPLDLVSGDVAIQTTGNTHKIRCGPARTSRVVEQLATEFRGDHVLVAQVGQGHRAGRLLSGRLKVFWPSGFQPVRLPATLMTHASDIGLDLDKLSDAAMHAGAVGVLNRAAEMLLVEAFRSHPYFRAQLRWNLQDPIARAQVLIERHPFDPWSVKTLADRVGMGRSNFAARFVAETGKTPIGALCEERMKYAEQFLRDTDLRIEEVGEKIGYRSEAAFVRQFTRYFHITPSKLRKQEASRMQ